MAKRQKALKKERRTGPYKVGHSSYRLDHAKTPDNVKRSWVAARKVRDNALRITAVLNLYHEKRGSNHRHNVPDHLELVYGKIIMELENALEKHSKDMRLFGV